MRCEHCGATFADQEIRCPYCGWENRKAAEEEQKREVRSWTQKLADFLRLPERIVRRLRTVLLIVAACVVGIIIVAMLITYLTAPLRQAGDQARRAEELSILEEYYQNGEYEKMDEYLWGLEDYYQPAFQKYSEIAVLGSLTEYTKESVKWAVESLKSQPHWEWAATDVALALYDAQLALCEAEELRSNGFLYENEEKVVELEREVRLLMTEQLGLSEAQMDALLEDAPAEDLDALHGLALEIAKNWEEK